MKSETELDGSYRVEVSASLGLERNFTSGSFGAGLAFPFLSSQLSPGALSWNPLSDKGLTLTLPPHLFHQTYGEMISDWKRTAHDTWERGVAAH